MGMPKQIFDVIDPRPALTDSELNRLSLNEDDNIDATLIEEENPNGWAECLLSWGGRQRLKVTSCPKIGKMRLAYAVGSKVPVEEIDDCGIDFMGPT